MKLSKAQHYALEILAGCPDGATSYALQLNRDIAPATLYRLVEANLARVERQTLREGTIIWRFWITDAGKQHIAT